MAESRSEKKNEEDAQERISMLCEPMYKTLKANSTNNAATQIKNETANTSAKTLGWGPEGGERKTPGLELIS
jgi:hypothetical protein